MEQQMHKQLLSIKNRIALLEAEVNKSTIETLSQKLTEIMEQLKNIFLNSSFGKTLEERKNVLLEKIMGGKKLSEIPKDYITKIAGLTPEDIKKGANELAVKVEELKQTLLANFDTLMYMSTGNEQYLKDKSFLEKTKLILQKYILSKDINNTPDKIVDFLMKCSIVSFAFILLGIAMMSTESAFAAAKKHIFEVSSKFGKALRELDPVKSVVFFIKLIFVPLSSFIVALKKSPIGTIFFTIGASIIGYCGVLLYTYKEYGILK